MKYKTKIILSGFFLFNLVMFIVYVLGVFISSNFNLFTWSIPGKIVFSAFFIFNLAVMTVATVRALDD